MAKNSLQYFIDVAKELVSFYPKILPPQAVLDEARKISENSNVFEARKLGLSKNQNPIDFYSAKMGPSNTLWYGFPDPGEAVGATGILSIMRGISEGHEFFKSLGVSWNFVPVLNFDDQPDNGKSLQKIMKNETQEVDWLVNNPRPETSAVVNLAGELRPIFTFPLHDEFHCKEDVPVYFPVSRAIEMDRCDNLRTLMMKHGLSVSRETSHPEMKQGFFLMSEAKDYANSTFSILANHGLVLICEIPNSPSVDQKDLVSAQVAAGLYVLSCEK